MFVSRSPGERFVRDHPQGPELRQGLELFRVINRTGLQIRKDIALDSEPSGRLYAGDVFCVNDSMTVLHHRDAHRPGKRKTRGIVSDGSQEGSMSSRMDQESRATTPRTRWLHSRDGVWPVAVSSIPGPKYLPAVSAVAGDQSSGGNGVSFPKEMRFLSNVTRYLSKDHERQARGLFSPGPAMYMGHDEMMPLPRRPASSDPGSASRSSRVEVSGEDGRGTSGDCLHQDALRSQRAATAGSLGGQRTRRRPRLSGDTAKHTPYIGIKEREAADRIVLQAKAGATGAPVMRLLLSRRGEREGPDGCFVTRKGAASPGPARHFPNCSSISSKGCPIFAAPTAMDPSEWERQNVPGDPRTPQLNGNNGRSKTSQVHRRWPSYTHMRDAGRISGILGQDSPGPGTVNIADHDPFRPRSFLKKDVCHPPPASVAASHSYCVPFG
eukprot:g3923.t1